MLPRILRGGGMGMGWIDYPRVEPGAMMLDPVGVHGWLGGPGVIPGLKPGVEMLDPVGVPKYPKGYNI